MANFLATLKEMGPDLWCLVLVNAGVKLAVAGSPVLASLRELEQARVQVLVCGTCLNHFHLLEQKEVGKPPTCWTSSRTCRWPTRSCP